MRLNKVVLLGVTVFTAFGANARADFASDYQAAFGQYLSRGEGVSFAEDCVSLASLAFNSATTDEEKFNALVLQSRCTYFVGTHARTDEEKVVIHNRGKALAERAKNILPNRAEGYYYFGINLGRWALANGIAKSLGERNNLRSAMESVKRFPAKDDQGRDVPGREYDGWGANRTLGHLFAELPPLFGRDTQAAERLLREAVDRTPSDAPNGLNIVYLAEVLVKNDKKAEARQLLDRFLAAGSNPEAYNPARVPETRDELREARRLRDDL